MSEFEEFAKGFPQGHAHPKVSVACQVCTCKFCGTTELHWIEVKGKHRLAGPHNILHVCREVGK